MPPVIPDHVDLIVTHGGCHDGFTAEWLLHRRWPDAECHRGVYNEDTTGLAEMGVIASVERWKTARHGEKPQSVLVMADFSYKLVPMLDLASTWDRIIILDHHASAIDALDGHLPSNVETVFDVNRSGAGIVADWLGVRDNTDLPYHAPYGVVDYVEDRDLWRFDLPHSKEAIQYLIAATPHTYDEWDLFERRLRGEPDRCFSDGLLVGRYHNILVDELVACARPAVIDGHDVLMTPSPYLCGSDVAGRLAAMSPSRIGAYYRDLPDRVEYGLRSTDGGPDVAKVAERFGGGGHPHASGLRRARSDDGPEIIEPESTH